MKLSELRSLAQFDAIGTLMAVAHDGGWILCVFKDDTSKQRSEVDMVLETARGDRRVFKTLDAIKKLINSDLNNTNLLVV